MSEQKGKIFIAIFLAICSVSILVGASYSFFPSQENIRISPLPSLLVTPSTMPVPSSTTTSVLPVPSPVEPGKTPSSQLPPAPNLFIEVSQTPNVGDSFFVAQNGSITLNVTLTSTSSENESTIPMYLAIGAFQNQPLPRYKIIATPQSPYSTQLPWSAEHVDQSNDSKPFTANFETNPVTLKPKEVRVIALHIRAAENATLGAYSIILELGNWQQTNVGGTTFQLTVTSKS